LTARTVRCLPSLASQQLALTLDDSERDDDGYQRHQDSAKARGA
jgi:hypothetical protein